MQAHNLTTCLVVFIHGKESGPQGRKIIGLSDVARAHGVQTFAPDFSDLSTASLRVDRLLRASLPSHQRLILVGSSMGAYVACAASTALKAEGLFLMAPAIGLAGYEPPIPPFTTPHVEVVMGWQDEIIPVDNVIAWARERARLHLVQDDHRLGHSLDELCALFDRFLGRSLKLNGGNEGKP